MTSFHNVIAGLRLQSAGLSSRAYSTVSPCSTSRGPFRKTRSMPKGSASGQSHVAELPTYCGLRTLISARLQLALRTASDLQCKIRFASLPLSTREIGKWDRRAATSDRFF